MRGSLKASGSLQHVSGFGTALSGVRNRWITGRKVRVVRHLKTVANDPKQTRVGIILIVVQDQWMAPVLTIGV